MRETVVLLAVMAVLGVCSCDEQANKGSSRGGKAKVLSIPGSEPMVLITSVSVGKSEAVEELDRQDGAKIVAALWADGTVLWSDDRLRGGPLYRLGLAEAGRAEAMLLYLRNEVFGDEGLGRGYVGPDSDYLVIRAVDGERELTLRSWHESFEQKEDLVATAGGIKVRGDKSREAILAEEPADYRRFRDAWAEIRMRMGEMIPASGVVQKGQISLAH